MLQTRAFGKTAWFGVIWLPSTVIRAHVDAWSLTVFGRDASFSSAASWNVRSPMPTAMQPAVITAMPSTSSRTAPKPPARSLLSVDTIAPSRSAAPKMMKTMTAASFEMERRTRENPMTMMPPPRSAKSGYSSGRST